MLRTPAAQSRGCSGLVHQTKMPWNRHDCLSSPRDPGRSGAYVLSAYGFTLGYRLLYPGSLFILADFLRPVPSSYVCAGLAERFHCSFAYSALACFRIGMSGSASFHSVRKSSYALFALRCLLSSRRHDRFGDGLRFPTLYWQNAKQIIIAVFLLLQALRFDVD
jgi:hypothetical protein